MLYYVLPWSGANAGWYSARNAVKVFKREKAAEAYARKLNAVAAIGHQGFVVRSSAYVREA